MSDHQYARCPKCSAAGDIEGEVVVDAETGEPQELRERMECSACGCVFWEVWTYRGQELTEQ